MPGPNGDILTQARYQGGVSVIDFTDSANPTEIAFFDRGPVSADGPLFFEGLGGLWSTYWYNGHIYGSEIARGFDVFGLTPSEQMSEDEIAAASEVQLDQFNAQLQSRLTWAPSFAVVGDEFDQLVRADGISDRDAARVDKFLERAERFAANGRNKAAVAQLRAIAGQLDDSPGQKALAKRILELADTLE